MSDECSLEELTEFLEDDNSLDETPHKKGAEDNADVHRPGEMSNPSENNTATPSCTQIKQLPSKEDIQAELMAMQKRMMDLQKLLTEQNDISAEKKNVLISAKSSKNQTVDKHVKPSTTLPSISQEKTSVRPRVESGDKNNVYTEKDLGNDPFGDSDSDWGDLDEIAEKLNSESASTKIAATNSQPKSRGSPKVEKSQNKVKSSTKSTGEQSDEKSQNKVKSSTKSTGEQSDEKSWLDCNQNNKDVVHEGRQLSKDLFGDSDSDWEDMDGAEKRTLSSEGKTIRKIIKSGTQERVAHVSQEYSNNRDERPSWKSKPKVLSQSTQQPSPSTTQSKKNTSQPEEKFIIDSLTGIRIIKPLVSSTEMSRKMQDRKLIRMSRLHLKINTPDVQGNWVTIGVIVHKSDAKTSSTGKVYNIWKMCDLEDCERVVNFFLFGQVYTEHWKTNLGSVVGLLNPSIMGNADKGGPDVAFTINNPQQLLLMGQSKDLGWCRGRTKKGNACINFVSKRLSEYCVYHVQSAYRKASSKRSELQGSFTGAAPKSFEQKLMKSGGHFMYGGQTFLSSSSTKPKKKAQDHLTVKKLQSRQHSAENEKKITTMTLHELKSSDVVVPRKAGTEGDETFMELVSTPSIGSMNLVKHLIKQENNEKVQNEKVVMKAVTPKELLHEHRRILKEKQLKHQQKSVSPASVDPISAAPVLGKGFYPGSDIFLDCSPSVKNKKARNESRELSKKRAVAKVKASGGLVKEDPNAVRKKHSPDRIKKRVRESLDEPQQSKSEEPPVKRSKLLGNVDLNSEEIKKLMKARSSHRGALAEVEAEKEEKYFDELEKKEKMEEKMLSITEMKTTVFTCKQCHYTAYSVGESCKRERHNIVRQTAMKRFFKCKDCKTRTVAITKYPTHPCKNCNGNSFERTSMVKEKTGPKLDSEILCLRGDEVKFLNSLQENVF